MYCLIILTLIAYGNFILYLFCHCFLFLVSFEDIAFDKLININNENKRNLEFLEKSPVCIILSNM